MTLTDDDQIRIGLATTDDVREIRHRVLRPGHPLGVLDSPDDDRSVHVAAWDGDRVVGTVRILHAGHGSDPDAWQLRSMAVDPEYQGRGIGRRLLDAVVEEARRRGIGLLWANARSSALGFYTRAGWQAEGEEFIQPATGLPHYVITRDLAL